MPLSETKLFSRIDSRVPWRETQQKKQDGPRHTALAPEAQPGPWFVALAAGQRRPRSRGAGEAREAPEAFLKPVTASPERAVATAERRECACQRAPV